MCKRCNAISQSISYRKFCRLQRKRCPSTPKMSAFHVFFVATEIFQEFWQSLFFICCCCFRCRYVRGLTAFEGFSIILKNLCELKNTNTLSFYLVLQKRIASFEVMQATTTVKLYRNISLSYYHYDKWYLISLKSDYTL